MNLIIEQLRLLSRKMPSEKREKYIASIIEDLKKLQAKQDADESQLLTERDGRQEVINNLLDAVLGIEREEWSSSYGFHDAINDVEEKMYSLEKLQATQADEILQLHGELSGAKLSATQGWQRYEQANRLTKLANEALAKNAVPEGYQLMPIEPTPEIEGIFNDYFDEYLISKCSVKMIYKEALARVAALAAAKEQA